MGEANHHTVPGPRDYHGENPCLLGLFCRRGCAEIWDAAILGSNDDNPVELLTLADMSCEKVDSSYAEERVFVADTDALANFCWGALLAKQVETPTQRFTEARPAAGVLHCFEERPASKIGQRVFGSPARRNIKARQHGSDRFGGICIEYRIIPAVEIESTGPDLLIDEASTRARPCDDADPLVGRTLQHVVGEVDRELSFAGYVREREAASETPGRP
jgi:hypothetical protein